MSDGVKERIQQIPNFKAEIYKIKSISTVRNTYGIDSDETIISYRTIPKLLAKIETSGVVFTDKGVYKRLPSGYLSSDYETYSIQYEDMVDYIPYLGYSAKQQPQLIGEYTGKRNLSFWMTPVAGTESNDTIVSIFKSIISDVVEQDTNLSERYETTKKALIELQEQKLEADGSFDTKDETVLCSLISEGQFKDKQKEDAIFLVFRNKFANRNYSDAYYFVENNSDLMYDATFIARIDSIIRNKISTIGVPKANDEVEALRLYCEKNNSYIPDTFPNMVSYYFREGNYISIDEFMLEFENTEYFDGMNEILKEKIAETLPQKIADWTENTYSSADEEFVVYAMNKPSFYKKASRELVKHYCILGRFDDALENLNKVREVENNVDYIAELEEAIKEYTVIYAAEQFKKAQEYIEYDNNHTAVSCMQEAIKYDSGNQEYALALISLEIEMADYALAKSDIKKILEQKIEFDEKNLKKFQELEVECAEGITQEMCAFYDLLMNDNVDSLSSDSSILEKKDQFELSFYHYAILLSKDDVVNKINVSGTSVRNAVCNYDIRSFACGDEDENSIDTLVYLLRLYDDDARQLYKAYKRKKASNIAKKVGTEILNSMIDSALSGVDNADSRLRELQRDSAYSGYSDEIQDKHYEVAERKEQFKNMKSSLQGYSDGNIQSGDELFTEYVERLYELGSEKIITFSNKLDESVDNTSLKSKLIYMIIKNPGLLEEIFHGDRAGFALHEADGEFWYLPETLIVDASNLLVEYEPCDASVVTTSDDCPNDSYDDESNGEI